MPVQAVQACCENIYFKLTEGPNCVTPLPPQTWRRCVGRLALLATWHGRRPPGGRPRAAAGLSRARPQAAARQAAGAAAGPGRGQQGGPRHREALLALKAESEATEAAPLPRRPLPRRAACCERGRRASPRGGRRSTGIKYFKFIPTGLDKNETRRIVSVLSRSPAEWTLSLEEGSDSETATGKGNSMGARKQKRCASLIL